MARLPPLAQLTQCRFESVVRLSLGLLESLDQHKSLPASVRCGAWAIVSPAATSQCARNSGFVGPGDWKPERAQSAPSTMTTFCDPGRNVADIAPFSSVVPDDSPPPPFVEAFARLSFRVSI